MTLQREDFASYFAAMHDRHPPFAWQERLLDTVLDGGRWPDALVAPTGAGKTAAIDVHVFALALATAVGAPAPPRRLSMIVGRRVLVDDQYRYAREVAGRLARALHADEDGQGEEAEGEEAEGEEAEGEEAEGEVVEVAQLLHRLRGGLPSDAATPSPLLVVRLRGGLPPARRWLDHPTTAAVICATPDMWGSRLLFRGYGSSSRAWPRPAGLLAFDSVALVDEAHLSRQLTTTARRIATLAPVSEAKDFGAAPVQVVETTATPAAVDGIRVGVEDDDLVASEVLAARLERAKPVTLVRSAEWPRGTARSAVVVELAQRVVDLLAVAPRDEPHTVGCFLNTVGRAVAVANTLRNMTVDGRKPSVVLVCGQIRPHDVDRLRTRFPGLLTTAGNAEVDVVVTTQTLEVGVDIDLAAIVTELASASALVQRAGCVNRRGLRVHGQITVIAPTDVRPGMQSGPYATGELEAALAWIEARAQDPQGLAPWRLRTAPPPATPLRRRLLQRPELGDAWHWARTSDDLAADPELDLWLADDLEADQGSVGLVVREDLPDDAVSLIRALPPRRHEIFPVPLPTLRRALTRVRNEATSDHGTADDLPGVVVRGDDVDALAWRSSAGGFDAVLRPGDVVVVDAATSLFTEGGNHSPAVVIPADDDAPRRRARDVLEAEPELLPETWEERRVGGVVHRIEIPSESEEDTSSRTGRPGRRQLGTDLADVDDEMAERALVLDWLGRHTFTPMAAAAAALLSGNPKDSDVVVHRGEDDAAVRVLVIDRRRASADEDLRQEWTPNKKRDGAVTLESHQRAVAERVVALARTLGLTDDIVPALELAAAHHDDGKADSRFQIRLGARADETLAKSRETTPRGVRRRETEASLPPRWRHEQSSVWRAWPHIPETLDRDLVARLIGTTHGHGRHAFPHSAGELSPDADDLARRLFDVGEWDELMERTQHRYGVWGCAYLEAVLRAADGQISAEGR